MRLRRHAPILVLAAVVLGLAAWRVTFVMAGPDPDSDAYGHHAIARQILVDPKDLGVHWVWLPLFHYAQAIAVLFGATMNTVRYFNVAAWAAVPLVLFGYVRRTTCEPVTALIAALAVALSPIGMEMGTTAQPEPLFCLLVLGFVAALERERGVLAGSLLAAAALLRYEAWAVPPAMVAFAIVTRRRFPLAAIAIPLGAILAWILVKRGYDGEWVSFLRQTREFANDATKASSSLDKGATELAKDAAYYPIVVAWRVMSVALVLVPLGVARAWRKEGTWVFATYLGCLGFVTLTWILRSSLGLYRHFVVLVPFYATLAAHGAAQLGDWFKKPRAREIVIASAGAAAIVSIGAITIEWMRYWRDSITSLWPERRALGAYLRTLPEDKTIFCDDATLEILSGLDRKRFDRHWVDEPGERERVERAAEKDGAAYVATWTRKLKALGGPDREIVFRSDPGNESGVAVMRVRSARSAAHADEKP